MAERDLYKEAIADAKDLRNSALKNGMRMLSESYGETLKEAIEAELDDEDLSDEDEDTMEEGFDYEEEDDTMSENEFDGADLELDDEEDDLSLGDDLGDDEDDLEESAGFDEADLREALSQILDEVDHGDLGEFEHIDPDTHDTGLMDQDTKEDGWENKDVPAKKDWTVKEARKWQRKVADLVVENKKLRKAISTLKEAVSETQLFNRKLNYAWKLMEKPVVRENKKLKDAILKQLDSAKTIAEAEGRYQSLETALGVVSESAGQKRKAKKSRTLSEALGSQSKNERGLSSVRNGHLSTDEERFSPARMSKLAGLSKDD